MAVIWADNFQSYGTDETFLTSGLYASTTGALVTDPDPNASGNVYSTPTQSASCRFALPGGAVATGGAAFRFWRNSLPSTEVEFFSFAPQSDNNAQVALTCTPTGIINVYRDNLSGGGVLIGTSTTPVVVAGSWLHLEVKATINTTTGAVEVRINGVTKINISNVNTQANVSFASFAQVILGCSLTGNTPSTFFKDFVVWDTTGATNNDFLGSVAVITLRPDADISFNWDPSTGTTGYTLIDEATPNDADYISADDAPPAASVFGLGDLPADVTSVKAVLPLGRMRKTDGGDCNVQMSMVSGVSEDAGLDRPITSSFTYYWDVSELDPATAAPWTPAAVNSAQIKINRTL